MASDCWKLPFEQPSSMSVGEDLHRLLGAKVLCCSLALLLRRPSLLSSPATTRVHDHQQGLWEQSPLGIELGQLGSTPRAPPTWNSFPTANSRSRSAVETRALQGLWLHVRRRWNRAPGHGPPKSPSHAFAVQEPTRGMGKTLDIKA